MAEKQTLQQFGASIKAKHPEYKDMDDAALGKAVLTKYPQYSDMVAPDRTGSNIGTTPGGELKETPFMDRLTQMHPVNSSQGFGENVKNFTADIGAGGLGMLLHPQTTAENAVASIIPTPILKANNDYRQAHGKPISARDRELENMPNPIQALGEGLSTKPAETIASGIGQAGVMGGGELGLQSAGRVGSAIRTAAIGDTDAAALRGLRVPPGSPKIQSTLRSVEGARPYLQGASSLEDLQSKIPAAKNEVWGPYKKTVDQLSGKQVQGPDGPTTVGELEGERQQLSALNRSLKKGAPDALQVAQQKGMTQAQLLDREKAVQSALDPHLEQAGIDPKLIRQTFGQVADIGSKVAGKSTIIESPKPYGFAKLGDLSLTKPLSNIPTIGSAARDVAAGRYWSASPTDVGIREGFRTAGPKPDFRAPSTSMPPFEQPPRQLPSSTIGNAEFSSGGGPRTLEPSEGQAGIPHQGPSVPPAPRPTLSLPETASTGQRYVKPYVEPPEPSTIRPMPPQVRAALPAQASPGETQPYIAYRTIPGGVSGESTRIAPPEFMSPSQPLPSGTRIASPPLPEGAEGPTQGLRTTPHGLLPGGFEPVPAPDARPLHVYPGGSAFRNLGVDSPEYPAGSQFRAKVPPFNLEEYLKGQQQ